MGHSAGLEPVVSPVPVVVAVDGGGTKTDAVAVELSGRVVARATASGSNPQVIGLPASVALVDGLIRAVAGEHPIARTGLYLCGLDLPAEDLAYREAAGRFPWAAAGLDVANDTFALLRAGTDEPDAVAVVCGTGVNAVGVRADGRTVRFPALGAISGDWGGGLGLGLEALWHAARESDGRGPATALTAAVASHFGVAVPELIAQLHFGSRPEAELAGLAPAVFAAATAGDAVAVGLVDRQAAELVAFARAALARLELLASGVPVVFGGGIVRAGDERLLAGLRSGLAAVAPSARPIVVSQPPILGAALLTLARAGADATQLAWPAEPGSQSN